MTLVFLKPTPKEEREHPDFDMTENLPKLVCSGAFLIVSKVLSSRQTSETIWKKILYPLPVSSLFLFSSPTSLNHSFTLFLIPFQMKSSFSYLCICNSNVTYLDGEKNIEKWIQADLAQIPTNCRQCISPCIICGKDIYWMQIESCYHRLDAVHFRLTSLCVNPAR